MNKAHGPVEDGMLPSSIDVVAERITVTSWDPGS